MTISSDEIGLIVGKLTEAQKALNERLGQIGGCSDGYCIVVKPHGMHTNGGCRCSRNAFTMQRVVAAYQSFRDRVFHLQGEEQ